MKTLGLKNRKPTAKELFPYTTWTGFRLDGSTFTMVVMDGKIINTDFRSNNRL